MVGNTDGTTDPKVKAGLLQVRDGTAYFLRTLGQLADDEFQSPSLLPGWSRSHLIAHVGYNARAIIRLAGWAQTGLEQPMYPSTQARRSEIEQGATLSPTELRQLAMDTAAQLDQRWRGLTDVAWHAEIRTSQGRVVPASATLWMRTREVWLHAVDLDNGGSFTHFPGELIDHLLADVLSNWRRRRDSEDIPNFVLAPTDRDRIRSVGDPESNDAVVLHGTAVALARWATGRGHSDVVTTDGSAAPAAPQWL
ncbi:MAG: maleylpyruvate isomerase family mycothiol-dependent enzyme [Microbacteriaceae bacterium]